MVFLNNYIQRKAEDASDTKLINDVSKYGFHIVGITDEDDPSKISYCFTVGCYYSFGIPEVVIFGMNYEHVKILFWDYVAWAKKNAPIRSGVRTSDLTNLPLMLRDVDLSWYQPLLGYANWFYYKLPNPYPCMQLTWPDKSGLFDTEVGFDDKFRTIQPNLSLKCDESA